ncbi:MAG TPA: HD domain-containing protein [Smithellaceae bacterium]|nr:HD domain-containing protein [Smithellaceae bacterium]HRS89199.1 HD domain-containing protein [Smithellaceae bacterium]HRV26123.1 HD domain-containing protein [Smithellaceae bacterium]
MTPLTEKIKNDNVLHSQFLDIRDKNPVIKEIKHTVSLINPQFDFLHFDRAFRDVEKLFHGRYPGFRGCNTDYHDFKHTLAVVLAMARLIHGAAVEGMLFSDKDISLGLIAALMHDTGYIQEVGDMEGTGAKYTLMHIKRGIQFIQNYYADDPYFQNDLENFNDIISCTGMSINISAIKFASSNMELLGKMLGTADLLGQMSDRFYLEKLMPLFREFEEGKVPGFASEYDLLKKTSNFYHITKSRMEKELGNVSRFMVAHFSKRWRIERNIYQEAIDKNINYLRFVLKHNEKSVSIFLRRNSVTIQ